jgi:hypothetical protein
MTSLRERLANWKQRHATIDGAADTPEADSVLLPNLRLKNIDDPFFVEQREMIRHLVEAEGDH